MIQAILVFNNHGKPRLTKFYTYFVSKKVEVIEISYHPYVLLLIAEWAPATANNQRNIPVSE